MKEKEKSCSVPQCQGKWNQGRALSILGLSLPQQGVSFLPLKGLGKGTFELSGLEVTAVSRRIFAHWRWEFWDPIRWLIAAPDLVLFLRRERVQVTEEGKIAQGYSGPGASAEGQAPSLVAMHGPPLPPNLASHLLWE